MIQLQATEMLSANYSDVRALNTLTYLCKKYAPSEGRPTDVSRDDSEFKKRRRDLQ
jgi:hypothetical protein